MYHRTLILISVALCLVALPANAQIRRDLSKLDLSQAEQDVNKGGPALKAHVTASTFSFFGGGRGVGYLSDTFFIGGEGYGGPVTSGGQVAGGMGYGGFIAGSEGRLWGSTSYELSLLVGGGGGGMTAGGGGSLMLEPGVALSQRFGGGARGTLSLGYLYAPGASALSGLTIGLRLDFKELQITLPLDD